MPYYDRTEVSGGTDANKTNASKECIICYRRNFLDKGFRFQPTVCNSCHNSIAMTDINNTAILNINSVDYRCIIKGTGKNEAMNLLIIADMSKEHYKI